jgi:hypothetical protein
MRNAHTDDGHRKKQTNKPILVPMDTLQEFYNFFESLPESSWNSGSLTSGDTHCALGHLKSESIGFDTMNSDSQKLTKLLAHSKAIPVLIGTYLASAIVWQINDGFYFKEFSTPKERILYAIKLAMDAESITDWLDSLLLDFLDDWDRENGIGVSTPIQTLTENEFQALLDQSVPAKAEQFVSEDPFIQQLLSGADRIQTQDDGFLASLLQQAPEQTSVQLDAKQRLNEMRRNSPLE